jgi:hypothetical protein
MLFLLVIVGLLRQEQAQLFQFIQVEAALATPSLTASPFFDQLTNRH